MAGNQINFLIACNSVIYTIGLTIELPHGIISSNNVHGRRLLKVYYDRSKNEPSVFRKYLTTFQNILPYLFRSPIG